MFISDEEKDIRLRTGSLQVQQHRKNGRPEGRTNIPDFLRPIIGASAHFQSAREVAKEFGVSKGTVDLYKHGMVAGSGTRVHPDLKDRVDSIVGQVREKAAERLMAALGLLTDEKLATAKARDLSGIAADMSRVIEKSAPRSEVQATQIIIYAPSQRPIERYEVIEASDRD